MWMRWLRLWGVVCGLSASLSAMAVSEISLNIERIDDPSFSLSEASAHYQVDSQQQLLINAHRLRIGQVWVQQPRIRLNIHQASRLEISSDQVSFGQYQAKSGLLTVDLGGRHAPSSLSVEAQVKAITDTQWGRFHLHCDMPSALAQYTWRCADGIYQDPRSKVPFSIDITPNALAPAILPKDTRPEGVQVLLRLQEATFSDVSGLHAAERLSGSVLLSAEAEGQGWRWHGKVDWQSGALFWQPFYFAEGDKHFEIRGLYQPTYIEIEHAVLDLPGVGQLTSSSRIRLADQSFDYLKVDGRQVNFAGVYRAFIQPLLSNSAFGQLNVSGTADWSFEAIHDRPQRFLLNIQDASVEDKQGKFAFRHFNASIPWDYDVPKPISIGYQSGHVLNIPLGSTQWQAEVNRFAITAPRLSFPILDGALEFEDLSAAWIQQSMVWHLKMHMQPISLASFSQALGWPAMRGQIDGHIPLVSYANRTLRMAGEMNFSMFKGNVAMSDLEMQDPLGANPILNANLSMRNIDLGEITRTFNFGSISGKLEGDVKHLKLVRWKPVYMDAVIQTADGIEEKTISQRAVENITALGGEGTAKALQRTVLRFFNAFNYEKIGIQCALRGDICKMGGVVNTPQGFVILKGKGFPLVNVNGYTEYVSWKDVLSRMQRITDSNRQIIIQ